MSSRLPKVRRTRSRSPLLTYALGGVAILLLVALGVLLATGDLFTGQPASDAERDYILLKHSVEKDPKNPALLMTLAEAEYELGRRGDSLAHAEDAIAAAGEAPAFRLRYAGLLLREGKEAEARKLVNEEIALETPGDAEPYFLLAQIDGQEKKYEAAFKNMEEGLRIAPTAADMRIVYAELLAADGKKAAAIEQYSEALRFLPGDERAIQGLTSLGAPVPSEDATSPHSPAPASN